MSETTRVERKDVVEAAERIAGQVLRTPLIETTVRGHRLWLKCECLQTGGAFKLRGATNRLLLLSPEERGRGVVAFSSGNHAQGVAIAANRLGIAATIVMPADAPRIKIEATRAQGAKIVFFNRARDSREAIAASIAADSGATVVPSFDDPHIVAGQGSVGIEIVEQLAGPPLQIVVPTGGGGLASGIALACREAQIVCVEPEGWDDMGRSLAGGEVIPVGPNPPPTLCDALQTPRVSPITFAILRDRRARALAVSEAEVREAMRFAWREHQMTVEPGGSVALAALIAGKLEIVEGTVAVVSGGNVDPELHARIIADEN